LFLGSGKTVITLTALAELIDGMEVSRTLIIAPLRVANTVWEREAANWEHTRHLDVSICTGAPARREAALAADADIYVINRENIPWLVKFYGKRWPFDCVVIDEASSVKNSKSQRFRALKRVRPKIERLIELTGTPAPNGLIDLWAQAYLIDQGARLCRTKTAFLNKWFEADFMGYAFTPRPGADDQIHAAMRDVAMTLVAEDYLDMPERIDVSVPIHMPAKALKDYRTLEKEFLLHLDDADVTALGAAALANKTLQACNGFVYDEEGTAHDMHSAKLDALAEIVEDNPGENLLVAYNFRHDLARLRARFPQATVLDKEGGAIDEWNAGEIPMLLAHPACLHPETEVLTENREWVRIVDVRKEERVFDGVEFVNHRGCHFSGISPVINKLGISMTPCHKILINNVWVEASNVQNSENTREAASYRYSGNESYLVRMLPLWVGGGGVVAECKEGKQRRKEALFGMLFGKLPPHDEHSHMEDLVSYAEQGIGHKGQRLSSLWGGWSRCVRRLVGLRKLLQGYVANIQGPFDLRSNKQRQGLQQGKLPLGDDDATTIEQKQQSKNSISRGGHSPCRILQKGWCKQGGNNSPPGYGDDRRRGNGGLSKVNLQERSEVSPVYDLVDCGPRNRFLIRNPKGDVFISHNSAGHGLNLQKGGSMLVWYGLNWSLELYEQFNGRLHRQGQRNAVRVIHIVAAGCIDERVMQAVQGKARTQKELIDALKI